MRIAHRLGLVLAASLGIAASAANAVEVRQEADVPATPSLTWKKIGAFCAIKAWHPAIAGCDETKAAKGTYRLLTLKDGGKINELRTATGTRSYSYSIEQSPLPVKDYKATLAVTPGKDAKSAHIVWSAKFDANGKSDAEAKAVIDGIFTAGLNSIGEQLKADADKANAAAAARKAKFEEAKKTALDKLAKLKTAASEKAAKAKLAAAEKLAKAKEVLAEKSKQAAEAAKATYDKAKAAYEAAKAGASAPAKN